MSAELLDKLSHLWLRNFPKCVHRAHWHIANLLIFETGPLGATVSNVEGYLRAQIGLDPDTSRTRLAELLALKLITLVPAGVEMTAISVVQAERDLSRQYKSYHHDLLKYAFNFAGVPAIIFDLNENQHRLIFFRTQYIHREISLSREWYIFEQIGSNMLEANKANSYLKRRAHWTLFLVVWLYCEANNCNEVPLNRIYGGAFDREVQETTETLDKYLTQLVAWKFLNSNKRSYTINAAAKSHFSGVFAMTTDLAKDSVNQLGDNIPKNVIQFKPSA